MPEKTTNDTSGGSPRIYKILLMILPVGVVVGTVIFMFMYFYLEGEEQKNSAVIASHGFRASDLADMVDKFTSRIGERNMETEPGREGLRKAASMIEGRLGPQNVGYQVSRSEGEALHGLLWRSLSVEITGEKTPRNVVFAAVSYAGPGGDADANTVSTMLMLASSMARHTPACTIRFVFTPLDRSPEEQNQWLLSRCLKPGERSVGILGLRTLDQAPSTADSAWQSSTNSAHDLAWWNWLSESSPATRQAEADTVPSVWLSHTVFSSETWKGRREQRLERTLDAAQQLSDWLVRASE